MAEPDSISSVETWRPAPRGYENYYEVSDLGQVRRNPLRAHRNASKFLKPSINRGGYYVVCLSKEYIQRESTWPPKGTMYVHNLVAEAFLGERPEGQEVNHKDGNKLNNRLENLEYVSPAENCAHAWRLGLNYWNGEHSTWSKLTKLQVLAIRDLYATGHYTYAILEELFNVGRGTAAAIIRGENWKHLQRPFDNPKSASPESRPDSRGTVYDASFSKPPSPS